MAINPNFDAYGCAKCRGAFQVIVDEKLDIAATEQQLQEHLAVCTIENPYTDDPNIKGFA